MAQTVIEWNLADHPQPSRPEGARPEWDRILVLVGGVSVLGNYEIKTGHYTAGVYWIEEDGRENGYSRGDRRIAGWAYWPEPLTAKQIFEGR